LFDGIEAVAQAAGQPVDRSMLLGMGLSNLGIDNGEFLVLDKPVAVVMPVDGMMMQQKGFVASVPVTDAAPVIEALTARFATHTVDGKLHTFATDTGPVLFVLETQGYLRIGGSSDLVTRFDPIAGSQPTSAISLEVFLEPLAPMIQAGLQQAKEQMKTGLAAAQTDDTTMPYNSQAIGSILDLYIDGVKSVINNTASFRINLDVEDGYVRLSESLLPKPETTFASFVAAQKGGIPEIARFADPQAAVVMAGQLVLTDELRQSCKGFVERYMSLMESMFSAPAEGEATGEAEAEAEADAQLKKPAFWDDYMAAMGQFSDRWVDCWRGDLFMTFDFGQQNPFRFAEGFGMNDDESCTTLLSDMAAQLDTILAQSEELAGVFSTSEGPKVGNTHALLMRIDMMKLMEAMGQPGTEQTDKVMQSVYGDAMTLAMTTTDGYTLVTGGSDASDRLQHLASSFKGPATTPSFAPLGDGSGMFMNVNLGRFIAGIKDIIPEGGISLEGPAQALSGEAGRIPMGISFDETRASFELAVPLKTIETIAGIIREEKAKAAAAQPADEPTGEDEPLSEEGK